MPDDIERKVKFSDLPSATSVDSTNRTLLVQGVGGGEITKTTTVENISNYIVKDAQYSELTTTNKKIIAAINEVASGGGGAESLSELSDVEIMGSGGAQDGQGLVYSSHFGKWVNNWIVQNLGDLGDVDIDLEEVSTNQVFVYVPDWDCWTNLDLTLSNINDVNIDAATIGTYSTIMYDGGSGEWLNQYIYLGSNNSGTIRDVNISNPESNQVLSYDNTHHRWENTHLYREITGTLTIGSTSVVLTNTYTDVTVANASLEVFTDTFGVNPTDITVSGNNISLTFEAQSSTVNVKARLWK